MAAVRWSTKSILNACNNAEVSLKAFCFIQVRFRKPRHLGRAKSKDASYFAKKYPTAKDQAESLPIYQNYNMMLKSLVAGFQEQIVIQEKRESLTREEEHDWDEEAHHHKCMQFNDAENARLRQIRMERIKQEQVKEHEELKLQQQQKELEEEKLRKIAQLEVEKTISESKDWITFENMEEKIIEAIDNPINFNFCVDRKGIIVKRTALTLSSGDNETPELTDSELLPDSDTVGTPVELKS